MPRNMLVYLFDDDTSIRDSLMPLRITHGWECLSIASVGIFFSHYQNIYPSCILLNLNHPHQDGLELQKTLTEKSVAAPVIFLSDTPSVARSVQAMKAGAIDVLLKPVAPQRLVAVVQTALMRDLRFCNRRQTLEELRGRFQTLTPRERQVLPLVIGGMLNKQAAALLGIAEVTLQVHRAQIMRKTKATSLPDLVRMSARLGVPYKTRRTGDSSPVSNLKKPDLIMKQFPRPDRIQGGVGPPFLPSDRL